MSDRAPDDGAPDPGASDQGQQAGVAVVTGASRGAGRGIAIALGSHGYTVYVTGRTQRAGESALGGTIHDTAAAVTARRTGGSGRGRAGKASRCASTTATTRRPPHCSIGSARTKAVLTSSSTTRR